MGFQHLSILQKYVMVIIYIQELELTLKKDLADITP